MLTCVVDLNARASDDIFYCSRNDARVVLIFDERETPPDLMLPSLCVGIASRTAAPRT
jgi:hypothetical protein